MNDEEARNICQQFANKHKVIFEDKGECGFGRPCVGFTSGDKYVDYNPCNSETYETILGFEDENVRPGKDVPDAYHKHNCMAVLVHGDHEDNYNNAIHQLATWVLQLEALGEVEIVKFETGAKGIQAILTGILGRAVRIKKG